MKILNKKGQAMSQLQGFILGIIGVAITLVVGLIVLTSLQTSNDPTSRWCGTGYTYNASQADATGCLNTSTGGGSIAITHSTDYTATGSIITKLATVPTWIGIVIVVALAFVVLGFFYTRGQQSM
jgi:hypothetical protein